MVEIVDSGGEARWRVEMELESRKGGVEARWMMEVEMDKGNG